VRDTSGPHYRQDPFRRALAQLERLPLFYLLRNADRPTHLVASLTSTEQAPLSASASPCWALAVPSRAQLTQLP
jgi:hypothetical protein